MNKRIVKANELTEQGITITDLGLDATKEEMSVSQFMDKLKVFKFNDPIQRNCVWNVDKKSLLIVSLLQNVPIGHFMVQIIRDNKQKIRNIIDGKQRLTTIRDYIKNKFTLTMVDFITATDENGEEILVDVSGLTFEQLPKTFQNRITATMLEFRCFEMDDNLKQTLFFRWNNGEVLNSSEKRKSKMSNEFLSIVTELKEKPCFNVGFSESSRTRDKNMDAVLQAMTVLITNGNTSLDSKTLDQIVEQNVITNEVITEMRQITDYLDQVVETYEEKQQREVFKKNKITSMVLAARIAIEKSISPQLFSDWAYEFFDRGYKERGFSQYGSTAKKENVKKRIEIMLHDFRQYFNISA